MSCSQRCNFFLLYCLLAMVHVRQTVNSLQDETSRNPRTHHHYRHNSLRAEDDSSVRDDHHHHHQHYHHQRHRHHHLQQLQDLNGAAANPIKTNKMHLQHERYMHARRRIEEAVHAFHSPSTMRPTETTSMAAPLHPHHNPRHRIDNRQPQKKPLPWIVNHRSPAVTNNFHFTTAMPSPASTTRTTTSSPAMQSFASAAYGRGRVPPSHQQRSLPSAMHSDTVARSDEDDDDDDQPEDDDDEDYYYYGDDDDNENADEDADAYGNSNDEGEAEDNGRYLLTNSETSPSPRRDNAMDYDDNFLADEPSGGGGSLTEQKLRNYSTPENVERMRNKYIPEAAVRAHINRMLKEATCKYPRPRVIAIPSEASKEFVPHCTVLHQCGSDTGCCDFDKTCVPKRYVTVYLDFYVIQLGRKDIETLPMINHTECHCVPRSHHRSNNLALDSEMRRPTRATNQCVKDFELIIDDQDYMRCDCVTGSGEQKENCERLKKGEEGFAVYDRLCISRGRCKPPTCEYGEYDKTAGRCPEKGSRISPPE